MGEPDDITYRILYLTSDESNFVIGIELVIDSGYVLYEARDRRLDVGNLRKYNRRYEHAWG